MLWSRPIRVSSQAEIQSSWSWGKCGKVSVSSQTKNQMSWSRLEPEGLVYNPAKLPHNHIFWKVINRSTLHWIFKNSLIFNFEKNDFAHFSDVISLGGHKTNAMPGCWNPRYSVSNCHSLLPLKTYVLISFEVISLVPAIRMHVIADKLFHVIDLETKNPDCTSMPTLATRDYQTELELFSRS